MGYKPSKKGIQELETGANLTPMMNLIMLLIPCLLMSTVFIEITVLNVAAPSIGAPGGASDTPPQNDKPPLNLTVTITSKGYTVAGSGGVLGAEVKEGEESKGPTIPIKEASVNCSQYIDTVPVPRDKNRDRKPCTKDEAAQNVHRTFWIYDNEALQKKLIEIKDAYEDEERIIISAEQDVHYEAVIHVIDVSRQVKDPASGEVRELFPEVVISPGFM